MSFKDEIFPKAISLGGRGGPQFAGRIVSSEIAGTEHPMLLSSMPRFVFDVAHAVRTEEQAAELLAFYLNMNGAYHSFRYWDHLDYTISASEISWQTIAGASPANLWQMWKKYVFGGQTFYRKITKPINGTWSGITGLVSLDYDTGILTASGTPSGGAGEFHVHARFGEWEMQRETINRKGDGTYLVGWSQCRIVEKKQAN